ncbi:MAG: asparagine synthase B [Symbiobacteriia bacterium]
MCGIVGVFNVDGQEGALLLEDMLDSLRHRGPDGRGLQAFNEWWLGHQRLAIVDLATGAQPMIVGAGPTGGAVNGEIYNHLALRAELGETRFRTRSDSEAVLRGVCEFGPSWLKRLDGMYAAAVVTADGLLLARDPLGIKPLYIGRKPSGEVLFASEIKALLRHSAEVLEVPPGTWWRSDGAQGNHSDLPVAGRETAWQPDASISDPNEAIRLIGAALETAVVKRLMADVPVGVFLSGGLDSSLIAALAVKHSGGRRLKSFAVGLAGSADLQRARQVADYLGTEHYERVVLPQELPELLPRVIYHLESYDPSLVRSAVVTYLVSELASRHVKVVLSGEGADELFAGYRYLSRFQDPSRLQAELLKTVAGLHNTNLQRVDRMTMAHGLEGRVPFLDAALVRLALSIDPELKLHRPDRPAKWLLRRVAEAYLPQTIAWREKEKFAVGSGAAKVLENYAEAHVSHWQMTRLSGTFGDRPETKEEWFYQRLFRRYFHHPAAVQLVGHSRSLNPGELTRWAREGIA